jgi:serine/threonine protein kinase
MKLNKIDKMEIKVFEPYEISIITTTEKKPSGSFGEISLGFIIDGNIPVVVKRYKDWDSTKVFKKDMMRELIIIQFLNQFPETNTVRLYGILYDESKENCYLVLERLNADLTNISIKLINNDSKKNGILTPLQYKTIFYKLLKSIHAIHSLGFIHNDIKLANIMINDTDIKIIDFGLAKFIGLNPLRDQVDTYMTTKVIKAPDERISFSSDSFSIAATIVHLVRREYFSIETLNNRIIQMINYNEMLSISTFLKDERRMGILGFDLLLKLLDSNNEKRWCVKQALSHPYFEGFIDIPLTDILYGGISGLAHHTDNYTKNHYIQKSLELCYFEEMFHNYKDTVFPIKKIPDEYHEEYYKTINWLLGSFNYSLEEGISLLNGMDTLINIIIRLNNEFTTEPSIIIKYDITNKQIETCINMLLYNSLISTESIDIKYILQYKIRENEIVSYFYKYLQNINIDFYSVIVLISYIYLEIKHNLQDDTWGISVDFNFFQDLCVQVLFCFIHPETPSIDITIWDIVVFSAIHLLSIILNKTASNIIVSPIIRVLTMDYNLYNNLFEFYKEQYDKIKPTKYINLIEYFVEHNESFSFDYKYL